MFYNSGPGLPPVKGTVVVVTAEPSGTSELSSTWLSLNSTFKHHVTSENTNVNIMCACQYWFCVTCLCL